MESPKCKICGQRHYGVCSATRAGPIPAAPIAPPPVQATTAPPTAPYRAPDIQPSAHDGDIIERLRLCAGRAARNVVVTVESTLLCEAADEIERLRALAQRVDARATYQRDYNRAWRARRKASE